jgi:hypothetical protein
LLQLTEWAVGAVIGAKITAPGVRRLIGNGMLGRASGNFVNTFTKGVLGMGLYHTPLDVEYLTAHAVGSTVGDEIGAKAAEKFAKDDYARQQKEHANDAELQQAQAIAHAPIPKATLGLDSPRVDPAHVTEINLGTAD